MIRAIHALIVGWAIVGGLLLIGVVIVNVASVVGGAVWGRPFPGDFELTEVGVCVAVFCFLPYCQLTRSNVSADIFTSSAKPKTIALLKLCGSLVALVFSVILAWRMWFGMLDQKQYNYTTTILQIPHWLAFIPILVSLVLLAVAALLCVLGLDKAEDTTSKVRTDTPTA